MCNTYPARAWCHSRVARSGNAQAVATRTARTADQGQVAELLAKDIELVAAKHQAAARKIQARKFSTVRAFV